MTFTTFLGNNSTLATSAIPICVYRFNNSTYELLSNISVSSIQVRTGANPSLARFRYNLNSSESTDQFSSFEQAISLDPESVGIVNNDDRLVVICYPNPNNPVILFNGFAQVPTLSISELHELVFFQAYGVEVRAWDTPIGGALMQDVGSTTTDSNDPTSIVVHFNPRGEPNASTSSGQATDSFGNQYSTFVDPLIRRTPDIRTSWTLSEAVRYLCFHENANQSYVLNPDGTQIDALLNSRTPINDIDSDQANPSSYRLEPIEVPDYPATGNTWPNVLEDLLTPCGFGMAFLLESNEDGSPQTRLELLRTRDSSSAVVKDLYLQERGSQLDPALSNVNQVEMSRDISTIINAYRIDSHVLSYEASFILAPGFEIDPKDALSTSSLSAFDPSNSSPGSTQDDSYRLYVFDETGEGHWVWNTSTLSNTPTSLSPLFHPDSKKPVDHAFRRRVPHGTLFTRDSTNKPLRNGT